jgi:hypothetical protein
LMTETRLRSSPRNAVCLTGVAYMHTSGQPLIGRQNSLTWQLLTASTNDYASNMQRWAVARAWTRLHAEQACTVNPSWL